MKKYNVGIIGYGWAAGAHIAAINASAQAQVTAVCSSRPLDGAELSARHGGRIKTCQDVAALLAAPAVEGLSRVRRLWKPGLKLIVGTHIQDPAEQHRVYDAIHEMCG
jgi:hypothetical protein